jgi:hypothetical protein
MHGHERTDPVPVPVMTGLTWQDLLDLPGEIRHASLVDGDLYVNAPALVHQVVVSELLFALVDWTNVPSAHVVRCGPGSQAVIDPGPVDTLTSRLLPGFTATVGHLVSW